MNQNQDRKVVLAVVWLLGCIALLAVAGVLFIVGAAQIQHDKVDGAAIGIVAGFAGTTIGALAALLVNGKTNESNAEAGVAVPPEPVVVTTVAAVAETAPPLSAFAHLAVDASVDAGNGALVPNAVTGADLDEPVRDEAAFAAHAAGEPPPIPGSPPAEP